MPRPELGRHETGLVKKHASQHRERGFHMQAAVFHGPGDIRIENVPDPRIQDPTDAIVRITLTAICGSDLWFYRGQQEYQEGWRTGHEPMGVVEAVGNEVRHVKPGDLVLAPFAISDGTCEFCRKGLQTSCLHGNFWARDLDGAQGGAVRVIAIGHHEDRLEKAKAFGATDLISDRGEGAADEVIEMTRGGADHVLECVGAASSMGMAIRVARPGGTIGYVGVPHGVVEKGLDIMGLFFGNLTLRGGPAPVRAYMPALMEDV